METTTDNLKQASCLIESAIECINAAFMVVPAPELLIDINNYVNGAFSIMEDEEMEVIRFGDLTRTTDPTYQPYASIKAANDILSKLILPVTFNEKRDAWIDVIDRLKVSQAHLQQVL
ncbi:hypothetical protein LZD49_07240 [Dyadobacter sp. CY261]|uniref:hypothetical protein n=1 Tax=Dyadobacter sp. CY261 TaxID=2907203 RepID=UPI001F3C815D|nr:hypothetical protein [Dyadobacter sp. CY261]MCF0070260.1 hypothetical protein [Dyadobacter sp. CY261]